MANWDTNLTTEDDIWGIGDLCFEYNIAVSADCPSNTPSLSVSYLDAGVEFATDSIQPIENDGVNWIFSINAKSAIECFFDNTQSLCDPGSSTVSILPKIDLTIEVTAFEGTPSDCCLEETFTDTSPVTVVVGNHLIKPGVNYDIYNPGAIVPGQSSRFMTNRPQTSSVCLDQSLCICYLSSAVDGLVITAYDSSGAVLWSDFVSDGTFVSDFQFVCAPVGPQNIANMGLAGVIDESVAYYDIQMAALVLGNPVPIGGSMRFGVVGKCCSGGCRVHYLNCFGTYESIYCNNFPSYRVSVGGSSFQKAGTKSLSLSEFSVNTIQTFSQSQKVIRIDAYNKEEAEWLREVSASPSIFVEENNELYSYRVEDSEVVYWDQTNGATSWDLTISRSHVQVSHRN